MDNYQELLARLAEICESDAFEAQEDGALELMFDDRVLVVIQPDQAQKHVAIYSVVGALGEVVSGQVLLSLLSANLFGRDTNGATFAVEEATGQIVLQHTERLEGLLATDFDEVLADFVDAAEFWLDRLADTDSEAVSEAGAPADSAPSEDESDPTAWMSV